MRKSKFTAEQILQALPPRLFEPECHSPRQMKLANALCRYRELGMTLTGLAKRIADTPWALGAMVQ